MSLESPLVLQLNELCNQVDDSLKPHFEQLSELTQRKLWHQVTLKIEEIVRLTSNDSNFLKNFYFNYIDGLQGKLNQLKFVIISISIAQSFDNKEESINFLNGIANKVNNTSSQDAFVLANIEIAHQMLLNNNIDGVKEKVLNSKDVLDKLAQVDTIVHAHYYRVASEYFKAYGDFTKYYYNCLLYLSCINIEDLNQQEKVARAYDLSLAALLGDTIFNFGELLSHPISLVLKSGEHEWLYNLLIVFNNGEIGKLDSLMATFHKQPLLEQHKVILRQKMILMGLMEFLFKQDNDSHSVSFESICMECRIPIHEVEHLIMKALSLKLIKGSIDQVGSKVEIEWVQPRYLDQVQLKTLDKKLTYWKLKVDKVYNNINELNPELNI
ncbi:PCI-domain-containing protein [Neoconidiobolus thromboides FSU 785]|nr:PCI-domain-containing protein [Neoconidiobolus thromboides FSU 785]